MRLPGRCSHGLTRIRIICDNIRFLFRSGALPHHQLGGEGQIQDLLRPGVVYAPEETGHRLSRHGGDGLGHAAQGRTEIAAGGGVVKADDARLTSVLWKAALVAGCLLAFSRLYLYVHFPTDILGGIAVGILSGYLGYRIYAWLEARRKTQGGKTC